MILKSSHEGLVQAGPAPQWVRFHFCSSMGVLDGQVSDCVWRIFVWLALDLGALHSFSQSRRGTGGLRVMNTQGSMMGFMDSNSRAVRSIV